MAKRYKNGLCLGKFMPIHNGHVHFILEAAKQCETVHVMVCSRLCEPIEGFKREKWAKEIFKPYPNINVILCEDENPQYPEDDENFWQIWHDSVYSYVPELDVVFGSEDYIPAFAECLKIEGVIVDKDREAVPVSGTAVRTTPFDNWEHIPDVVKEEYRLKVAVVGPESTGKSTLCDKLTKHYTGIHLKEYGRWYTENRVPAKELQSHDFEHIAAEHYQNILMAEYAADKNGSKYIFMDTEAIVTRTFHRMYADMHNWFDNPTSSENYTYNEEKIESYMKLQMFGAGGRRGKIDLYLLAYPDLDWEDDGTRDFEDKKARMLSFLRIKTQLDVNNCNYHVVMGKGDLRAQKAIQIIDHAEKELREKPWHKLSFER
jgi:HTH-type transcriptional repressor of NAD biosynthesis genes